MRVLFTKIASTVLVLVLAQVVANGEAFVTGASASLSRSGGSFSSCSSLYQTGGWGIGPQRELTPEEFAKVGERRAFEGYKLRDRGEFMRQVARDKDNLLRGELDELLGVAKSAGIQVKDPTERLNLFEDFDEDELDVSVQWGGEGKTAVELKKSRTKDDGDSITRLDEDTGALGVW